MKKIFFLLASISVLSSANEEQAIKLENSIITSTTGFEESLMKENKNVTIIGKESLEKKEYKDLEEVFRDAPNVTIQNTYFGPVVDLRGNGERALSRVKVLVDGVAINPLDESMGTLPINTIPVGSIERIEVIPGGGAVLNGSGTAGGVINIITKSDVQKDYLSFNYGNLSHATNKLEFSAGYNLMKGLYANIGASYLKGNGYRAGDGKEQASFNGGFTYQITERDKIKFQGSYFHGNETTSTSTEKSILDIDRKAAGSPVTSETDRESYSLDYEFKASENLTFLTTLYYQHYKRDFIEKTTMDYVMNRGPMNITIPDMDVKMDGKFDETTYGSKVRGQFKYNKGELVLGYDYSKTDLKRDTIIDANGEFSMRPGMPSSPVNVNINIVNDIDKETNAIYFLNKYNFIDSLTFTAGARYEHSSIGGDRTSKTSVKVGSMPINTAPKVISSTKKSDDFAGELGLSYVYSDTGTVFFRYERGFISPLPGQVTDKTISLEYKPNNLKSETSDNFEIGFRDVVLDSYISFNLFTTFTNDEITLIQGNVHNPATKWWRYENLDKTRRFGAELFAEQYIGKLTLSEGITYIDSKIRSGEYKGEKVPLAPDMKITLGANYQLTPKFNAGITFNYVGSYNSREFAADGTTTFLTKVSGHNTTNLSFQYKIDEQFQITAGINNIFNSKYNLMESKNSATPADERNYFVSVGVKF